MGKGAREMEPLYARQKAVDYARKWALGRNPHYYSFAGEGGDSANFVSQCLYAGAGVMDNASPGGGWYYINAKNCAPAWSSAKYLNRFLLANQAAGPYASVVALCQLEAGDVIQLATLQGTPHHTLLVVRTGAVPAVENILVCAHSYDSLDRPLSTYVIQTMQCLHIDGVRAE